MSDEEIIADIHRRAAIRSVTVANEPNSRRYGIAAAYAYRVVVGKAMGEPGICVLRNKFKRLGEQAMALDIINQPSH